MVETVAICIMENSSRGRRVESANFSLMTLLSNLSLMKLFRFLSNTMANGLKI